MDLNRIFLIIGAFLISMSTFSLAANEPKDMSCFVCSNVKGNSFYKENCLDMSHMKDADKKEITVNCNEYLKYVASKLNGGKVNPKHLVRKEEEDEGCPIGTYNACRSLYYKYNDKVEVMVTNDSNINPKVGPFKGSTERVFRFCGCVTKKREKSSIKTKCYDVVRGYIRKRYCACNPDKPDLPCNAAPRLTNFTSVQLVLTLILSILSSPIIITCLST